jgi:hypothetical protein
MIKKICITACLVVLFLIVNSQQTAFIENFEQLDESRTVKGISGKALDLGHESSNRQVILARHSLTGKESGFTVSVWVKGAQQSTEEYDILSSLEKKSNLFDGWKLGVTARGGWYFKVLANSKVRYEYTTTAARQTIRDGDWHLLSVSYDRNELRFYYDGKLMAIYRADDIRDFFAPRELAIGGSTDSEHFFKKSGWTTYWDSFNGQIDDIHLYAAAISESEIRSYYKQTAGRDPAPAPVDYFPDIFTVTAFNIFHGGHEFGKETGKSHLIKMLRDMNSDAYLLVETYGSGAEIADALGYYLYLISTNLSIISRYPFTKTHNLTSSFNAGAAQVQLSNGKKINLVCLWLNYLPARNIGNDAAWSKEKFLEEENKTRGADMRQILKDVSAELVQCDSIPLIAGGDFNSGSHLDWTDHTRSIHKGYTMSWPASIEMGKAGFKDSFREIHPDALKIPGTTFYKTDRIDYIYYKGKHIRTIDSEIIGGHPVIFPSDHSIMNTAFLLGE